MQNTIEARQSLLIIIMFVKRSCKPELFLKDSDSELEEEIDILTDEGINVSY